MVMTRTVRVRMAETDFVQNAQQAETEALQCSDLPADGSPSRMPYFSSVGRILSIAAVTSLTSVHRQFTHVRDAEGFLFQVAVPIGDLHPYLAEGVVETPSPRCCACW